MSNIIQLRPRAGEYYTVGGSIFVVKRVENGRALLQRPGVELIVPIHHFNPMSGYGIRPFCKQLDTEATVYEFKDRKKSAA